MNFSLYNPKVRIKHDLLNSVPRCKCHHRLPDIIMSQCLLIRHFPHKMINFLILANIAILQFSAYFVLFDFLYGLLDLLLSSKKVIISTFKEFLVLLHGWLGATVEKEFVLFFGFLFASSSSNLHFLEFLRKIKRQCALLEIDHRVLSHHLSHFPMLLHL